MNGEVYVVSATYRAGKPQARDRANSAEFLDHRSRRRVQWRYDTRRSYDTGTMERDRWTIGVYIGGNRGSLRANYSFDAGPNDGHGFDDRLPFTRSPVDLLSNAW